MSSKHVLILQSISDDARHALETLAPDAVWITPASSGATDDQIRSAHVIIGGLSRQKLALAENLEWMQVMSAGVTELVASGTFPARAVLTNATGAYGLAISEHMIGMLLAIQKKLHLYRDNQARQLWRNEGPVTAIEGSTTLVVGLGDIGGDFARKMKALGSYTLGIRKHPVNRPAYLDELHALDQLDVLLPRADVVALSLPETPETIGIINRARLALMKPTAIVLNVGRGNAIDTEALCDALDNGRLGGAGLDVTSPEPLPSDHRLWTARNAVITPHISGGFQLQTTQDRIMQIIVDNFGRYIRGEKLINVVDFALGYRAFTD